MAVELITGHKGAVHVDAADDAALYAAIAGKGEYVLQLGSQLACTMATANKAHIASGHGLMQGRHWLVDAEGADVTIENGTQGQKRNDLIVARYERDAANGNVESVVLRAIKGTPTTGAAADPSYVHGDVLGSGALVNEQPLYRIPLDGITVGKPVRLFEVLTPQKDAWDSVSHIEISGAKVLKYPDGEAEVYFSVSNPDHKAQISFGGFYVHTFADLSLPIRFAETPRMWVSGTVGTGVATGVRGYNSTTQTTCSPSLMASQQQAAVLMDVLLKGRWK